MRRIFIFIIISALCLTPLYFISCDKTPLPLDPPSEVKDDDNTQIDPLAEAHFLDISYGEHSLQTMDIHIPARETDEKLPVVMTIHGGYWLYGDKKSMNTFTSDILASGVIHVNINHRVLGEIEKTDAEKPYIEMLGDIKAAFSYLALNADTYSINTDGAGIIGYSSGGHLALMYAYTVKDSPIPVNFVVSRAGPANFMDEKTFTEDGEFWFYDASDDSPDVYLTPSMNKEERLSLIGRIVGTFYGEDNWQEEWEAASPVYNANENCPVTVLLYGSHDNIVPISHAARLAENLNDPYFFELYGSDHDLQTDRDPEAYSAYFRTLLSLYGDLKLIRSSPETSS